MSAPRLQDRRCVPVGKDTLPLDATRVRQLLGELHGDWALAGDARSIARRFSFRDFHETMAFVNALAWIAHRADHHPDLEVGYRNCNVRYSTHAIGGLSENDFICAARIDALLSDQA